MKNRQIAKLKAGDDLLNEPYLLQEVSRRETKDGRPYLLGSFRDSSGVMGGVFWGVPPDVEKWVRPGLAVLVTGRVNNYRNALQITATDLNPMVNPDMNLFLPAGQRPAAEMIQELRETIADLAEPWGSLVALILLDPEFLDDFAKAPAARVMHHAYTGGLLDHTLSMVAIGKQMIEMYPYVNKDLLISGILLHDMGKALEYKFETGFDFSEDGRLVGHIVRATIMVETRAREQGKIDEEDLRHLVHLIASHHGQLEWGSPVVPKTLEAVLLHQIDLLDSRVQGFLDHAQNDLGDGRWTGKASHMFRTELLRPSGL